MDSHDGEIIKQKEENPLQVKRYAQQTQKQHNTTDTSHNTQRMGDMHVHMRRVADPIKHIVLHASHAFHILVHV